jgi:uncharacterized protein (TIGR03437 family)
MADPSFLISLFDRFVAGGGGSGVVVLSLSHLRGLSSEAQNAGGRVRVDLTSGTVTSEVTGLPLDGSLFDLWLVDNRPSPGHTTFPESGVYASEKQTSAIVPAAVASASVVEVQVEYRGASSNVVTLPVVEVRPGMFTADGSGLGQVAALNEDGSVNSPANPAARGSIISLFLTGAGLTVPQPDDSEIIGSIPPRLKAGDVEVLASLETPYDGADAVLADLLYAGAAPGSVQGVVQLNARIPQSAAVGGAVPVYVVIDRRNAVQSGVTMAVR